MNYPIKRTAFDKLNNKSNLGKSLELDINITNTYYLNNNIAVIHKKPTPIQVVRVNYPSRNKSKITEGYYKTPSTTDYNGLYKGRYIDFDAKETTSKTSFPLSNIQDHQIDHLRNINYHGGIAFLIVYWKAYQKYFILPYNILMSFWDNKKDGRKSIPYQNFLDSCYEVNLGLNPRLDYLKIIDKHFL